MNDLITVVIPTYNEKEELLRKAIDSILNQTYPRIELIVIDDGSTDATPEILKSYGSDIKVFRRERTSSLRSVSEAFNIGLEHAKGFWWHHDAADCWHEPDWAQRCIEFLAGREDQVLGVHTDFAVHHYDGTVEHVHVRERWKTEWSSFRNYMTFEALGGMLFRMDVCKKVGPWDNRFPRKQTREWTMRVLSHGNLVHLPKELWHFVFHEPDQMKRVASIKYRALCDLKNGWDLSHTMRIALQSEVGRHAFLSAVKDFLTDPVWSTERENGNVMKQIEVANRISTEEASEEWSE
ncbi:MAG: glycosyltransferase family 2 protein [Candidatus Thorarchaeota archaeon]